VPDKQDLDSLGRLLDQLGRRVGAHSRVWIATWFAAILLVTAVAAARQAPTAAYVILLVVAAVAVFAGDDEGDPL
jgi:hypothetical protein